MVMFHAAVTLYIGNRLMHGCGHYRQFNCTCVHECLIFKFVALVKAKLSIHQLDKAKSDLKCEVEKLGRENRELNSENEKLSRSKN